MVVWDTAELRHQPSTKNNVMATCIFFAKKSRRQRPFERRQYAMTRPHKSCKRREADGLGQRGVVRLALVIALLNREPAHRHDGNNVGRQPRHNVPETHDIAERVWHREILFSDQLHDRDSATNGLAHNRVRVHSGPVMERSRNAAAIFATKERQRQITLDRAYGPPH